jgi:hypothetical protein
VSKKKLQIYVLESNLDYDIFHYNYQEYEAFERRSAV